MRRILLHTVPYIRKPESFTTADCCGAWVVHQDLIRAILTFSSVEGVHFITPFLSDSLKRDLNERLCLLQQEYPSHEISCKHISDLHNCALTAEYVLVDDFEVFLPLAQARRNNNKNLFPVATITHSIPRHRGFAEYCGIVLYADPCDRIVTTSCAGTRAIKNILNDTWEFIACRMGVSPPPMGLEVVQIPLAVDSEYLQPQDQMIARQMLELPATSKIILYLGRFSESFKADLEPLIRVFQRLCMECNSNPNLHLLLAGQDSERHYSNRIMQFAVDMGVADRVSMIVDFPFSQKRQIYAACDVFVSPVDNIQETFGLSVLEAMACGKPVVASDWSGYRDLIIHGKTGFLAKTLWNDSAAKCSDRFSPFPVKLEHLLAQQTVVDNRSLYDGLRQLIHDSSLCRDLGSAGRRRVLSEFTWQKTVHRYDELWNEQWSILRSGEHYLTCRPPLDISRIFGHFATQVLEPETLLKTNQDMVWNHDASTKAKLLRINDKTVDQVLNICSNRPTSFADLTGGVDSSDAINIVSWLWKKGYLVDNTAKS